MCVQHNECILGVMVETVCSVVLISSSSSPASCMKVGVGHSEELRTLRQEICWGDMWVNGTSRLRFGAVAYQYHTLLFEVNIFNVFGTVVEENVFLMQNTTFTEEQKKASWQRVIKSVPVPIDRASEILVTRSAFAQSILRDNTPCCRLARDTEVSAAAPPDFKTTPQSTLHPPPFPFMFCCAAKWAYNVRFGQG